MSQFLPSLLSFGWKQSMGKAMDGVITLDEGVSSLGPRLPPFDLHFAFTIIHKIGTLVKIKWGRPGSIHHVNDVRLTQGERRRGGAQLPKKNVQDHPFKRSATFLDSRP